MLAMKEEDELNFVMKMYKNMECEKSEEKEELEKINLVVQNKRSLLAAVQQFLGISGPTGA